MSDSNSKPPVDMKKVIELEIATDQLEFEKTGNPVFVWSALGRLLEFNMELPVWVKTYLKDCAWALKAAKRDEATPYKDAVLDALGFRSGRGRDDLADYASYARALQRGVWMFVEVELRGKTPNRAAEELELSMGVDARTLRRDWDRVKERLEEQKELDTK